MLAYGFKTELLIELVNAEFATFEAVKSPRLAAH